MPAVTMATISSFTDWTPLNTGLTIGLATIGLYYHFLSSSDHMMKIRRIDSSSDLSKFYIHFQGGLVTNFHFFQLPEDVEFDSKTNIL